MSKVFYNMHSTIDNKGRIAIDCSECERGGNGSATDKCACGWQVKRPKHGACYLGVLIEKYHKEAQRKIDAQLKS